MDINDYQRKAARTINTNASKEKRVAEFILGLNEEAGEASSPVKKHLFHGHELDKEKLVLELGDVIWHVAAIATEYDITLEYIAKRNIDKLLFRYPNGFEVEKSINREV